MRSENQWLPTAWMMPSPRPSPRVHHQSMGQDSVRQQLQQGLGPCVVSKHRDKVLDPVRQCTSACTPSLPPTAHMPPKCFAKLSLAQQRAGFKLPNLWAVTRAWQDCDTGETIVAATHGPPGTDVAGIVMTYDMLHSLPMFLASLS